MSRKVSPLGDRQTCVALFYSTHYAIMAEKAALEAGLTVKLIPIPRHLSSDCGVCLCHLAEDSPYLQELLRARGIEYDRVEPMS